MRAANLALHDTRSCELTIEFNHKGTAAIEYTSKVLLARRIKPGITRTIRARNTAASHWLSADRKPNAISIIGKVIGCSIERAR
jgi:hypothetical protein